jgi:hypothetical protein
MIECPRGATADLRRESTARQITASFLFRIPDSNSFRLSSERRPWQRILARRGESFSVAANP